MDIGGISLREYRGQKIIKSLEAIAIIILIISFVALAYCVYISFTTEKNYASDYTAEPTSVSNKTEEKDISTLIENVNNAVVGISKIANKGTTIFLQDGASNLGLGTGFIVSKDGYIITNQHVSGEKNSTCYVTLENGKNYKASVVWSDTDLDLSIIKINVNNLKYLDLGDSDKIKVAEQVYAIGNPIGFEFQRTVTSGIISGLNRTIKIEEDNKTSYMEDLIQTDATINPGNSGGPLININGEVLGINSVKITSAEGIGFAIPINIIKPIIAAPIATTKTAPAAISFANFALGFLSGLTISTTVSIAVLNNSADITEAIAIIIKHHSTLFNLKNKPNAITIIIANTCIFIFLSVLKEDIIPSIAYLKLFINFLYSCLGFILFSPLFYSGVLYFRSSFVYSSGFKPTLSFI